MTECVLWFGAKNGQGYGTLWRGGKHRKAHRVAWEDAAQACLLPRAVIMHTCDTPGCVNPKHLRLGTYAENNADRAAKGRTKAPKGVRHNSARLTEAQVKQIRVNAARGMSDADQGRMFGVTKEAVRLVRLRRTWTHVLDGEGSDEWQTGHRREDSGVGG